ncbi:6-phospho-beta-glucosidase, partial [human gut metagenome]
AELNTKPVELEKRGGAYYSDAAVSLISAIYNDKKDIHTVSIDGIKGLLAKAIIAAFLSPCTAASTANIS